MANTLKFGNGEWYGKEGTILAYNDENNNYKPLPFSFSRAGAATRVNKEGLIEVVSNNEPRIDFLNDSKGALKLEPTRSNSITYSNDFSQSIYGKINLTITANQGISPDGTQNANLLVPNAAVGNRYLANSTGSNLKINTVFLKKKELRYVSFGNAQSNVLVDLENGTISADSVSTNNFTIENYGNGWYRVSCYNTLDVNLQIQIFSGIDGSGSNIATNGTDGVYIYGFEIQNGSYPTSYIPTQGNIGTRVAESSEQTVSSGVIGQTEGTIYFEFKDLDYSYTSIARGITLSDGTSTNRIYIAQLSSGAMYAITTGGCEIQETTPSGIRGNLKVAFGYKNNDCVLYVNGVLAGVDNSATTPICSKVQLGSFSDTANLNKPYKEVKLYNTRLSNSELQALTQV